MTGRIIGKVESGEWKNGNLELIVGDFGHDSKVLINGEELKGVMSFKILVQAGECTIISIDMIPAGVELK